MPNVNLTRQTADKFVSRFIKFIRPTTLEVTMFRKVMLSIAAVVAAILMSFGFTATAAQAYCGPGFTSKSGAIAYYKTPEGKKFLPSMKRMLIRKGFMHQDQSVMAFLQSPKVVFTTTPGGYTLSFNTACSGGVYSKFDGNYRHSHMGVLAVRSTSTKKIGKPKQVGKTTSKVISTSPEQFVHNDATGETEVYVEDTVETTTTYHQKYKECTSYRPFMKAYCRNVVAGRKWQRCKSFVRAFVKKVKSVKRRLVRKIPPPPSGENPPPGVSAQQQCEAEQNHVWNSQIQQCFVIVSECSIVVVGNGNYVTVNGDICKKEVPPPPPPPVTPPPSIQLTTCAHIFVTGNCQVYYEASGEGASGDAVITSGNASAWFAGKISVPYRWDGTPCPVSTKCYRVTMWATSVPGMVTIKATATGTGGTVSTTGNTDVKAETPGTPGSFDSVVITDSDTPGTTTTVTDPYAAMH